jgi:hypothetical protein
MRTWKRAAPVGVPASVSVPVPVPVCEMGEKIGALLTTETPFSGVIIRTMLPAASAYLAPGLSARKRAAL